MFVFVCKTGIMNPVAITKFFDIICKVVLLFLFTSEHCDGDLLKPILTYLRIIKINDCSMLYLHCLVWLKRASHLPTLCVKIWEKEKFCMNLLAF